MTPYEIIGAPLTLWLAPVGTAFPLVNAVPAVAWVKIGTNGNRNYDESGVTVMHGQSINKVRPAGATGAVKAFRNEEDLSFRLTLWDLSMEQYLYTLNSNTLTTTAAAAGVPGTKRAGLSRGNVITEYALLARGVSPYNTTMVAQYEVPRCYEAGSPEIAYRKGVPAGLTLMFEALENLSAATDAERFGRIVAQHQAPLP